MPPQPGLFEYDPYTNIEKDYNKPRDRKARASSHRPHEQHPSSHLGPESDPGLDWMKGPERKSRASSHRPVLDPHGLLPDVDPSNMVSLPHDRVKIIRGNNPYLGVASSSKSVGSVEPELRKDREVGLGKRKREVMDRVAKYSRDMSDRRDDIYSNSINTLTTLARRLHQNPADTPAYAIRLYPIALERAALLNAIELEEQHTLDSIQSIWKTEVTQIEDEFKKGKTRLRERVMEGLEERRRRAREEKEGEGTVPVELSLEAAASALNRPTASHPAPFTLTAPVPYGASFDELVSPFPLSLTSIQPAHSNSGNGPGRKPRLNRAGGKDGGVLTLGKAIAGITGCREGDVDHDLGEIRRGVKRRRAAAKSAGVSI